MEEFTHLQLILGVCLIVAAVLLFSMWKEGLRRFQTDDEKMKYLMFNVRGGGGLLAIFCVCGGLYVFIEAILKL